MSYYEAVKSWYKDKDNKCELSPLRKKVFRVWFEIMRRQAMSEARDKVKIKMARKMHCISQGGWDALEEKYKSEALEVIEQILLVPELAIVDREAKLPSVTLYPTIVCYKEALKKEGWLKEVKDG